jgi:regulatory protein
MSTRSHLLALMGRRDYTAAELRERLIDKGHDAGEVDEQIELLTDDGTINDRRVATTAIRVASQVKGRGRMRIRQELIARGVSKALADELLAELPADDEQAAIRKFLDRRRIPVDLPLAARQKVFQQLLRKGFTSEAITRALRSRTVE